MRSKYFWRSKEITKIRRRNMKHNPLKCRGLWLVREWNRKKIYPPGWKTLCLGQKNSEKNIYFSWKNCFFSLQSKKTNHFSSRNKSSHQNFSVPGILFPARRNIYSFSTSKHFMWLYKLNSHVKKKQKKWIECSLSVT